MKLKNEALEKLYDTIINNTIAISPIADSSMNKAFEECDERLSESVTFEQLKNLQNRNDILEKSNGTLLSANLDLCSKNRDLKNRIKQLEKELDEAKSSVKYFRASRDDWRNRAKHEEEEKTEQEKRADILKSQRDMLKKELDKANEKNRELQKDRDIWVRNNGEKQAEIAELKRQLDEVTSQYQKLTIENKRLQNNVRAGYDQGQTDLCVKLQDVKDMQPNEFDVECECLGDVIDMDLEDFLYVYKKWWEQKDIDRMRNWLVDFCYERDCKGCPLESIEYKCGCGYSFRRTDPSDLRIIPDKDIKRYYEKARGCGRYTMKDDPCSGIHEKIKEACDAFSEGLKAGLASEVKEVPVSCDIPIKDLGSWECTIEGNFELNKDLLDKICGVKPEEEKSKPDELVITTRGVVTANYTKATINAIKEAVRKFEKSLPALDSWESTITRSIKVDDILGKTNDTEHKLEYGDAVRLPWRDYDYMYIDADKNHIRLFNPKTHTVVLVSPSEKLTYQGCKIVLTDEDDLRKIWKDKK